MKTLLKNSIKNRIDRTRTYAVKTLLMLSLVCVLTVGGVPFGPQTASATTLNLAITQNSDDEWWYVPVTGWGSGVAAPEGMFQGTLGGPADIALRFQNVTVPQGATVSSATLTLTLAEAVGGSDDGGLIYGNDTDDAVTWGGATTPVNMSKTSASAAVTGADVVGDVHTIDVTSIVQEIVDRGGWASGNALAFGGDGTAATHYFPYYAFENGSDFPTLDIEYTEGGGGGGGSATSTVAMAELYMGARSNGSTAASAYVFNWVAPTGISSLDVEARAGGAGGGGSNGTGGGGGGGGGGYAQSTSVSITAGNTYALTIGHGGNGGAGTGAGAAGGDSSLSTLVVADGGTGGGAGTNGTAGAGGTVNTGDTTFNGGSGSAGAAGANSGAGGGGAGDANNGTSGSGATAGTGGSAGGGDGAAGRTTDGVGNNTTNLYGAGGGGGYRTSFTNRAGGSGTGGYIDLAYDYEADDTYPIIRGISGGRTDAVDGTSHSITLPPDIEAGELLVVVFSVDASETVNVNTGVSGSNWTKLGQANNSGTVAMTSAVFWKVAEGSDVLTLTTTSEQSSHLVYRIANHNGEVTGTSVGGNSTNSNPPSHTPAGGSANYLWLSTRSSDSTVTATSAPSGYSFWRQADASGINGAATDVAVRFANGTSEDPGTWTSLTEQWVSWTLAIAVQPDPGVYGTLYADEGTTPVTGGKTIKLAVGTTTPPNIYTTTTDTSTGAWSIAVPGITSTTTLVAWVDGDSSTKASTVALGSASGVVTLELYQDHVIAGSSDTDGSLDLADFAIYDSTSDADVSYTASTTTGTLELGAGMKLYIASGDTFALATTTILSGSFENNGTMTPGNSTTYFEATATIEGTGALDFNNVTASSTADSPVWSAQTLSGDWRSVTYGDGLFVAVGYSGNRVMTSPDGITWTSRSAVGDDDWWSSVAYGEGLFVAVSDCGSCGVDILMTSPDGITWTARSAAGDNDSWSSVTYGNGTFVAVAESGGTLVMTSPDGITWTARSAAGDDDVWHSVTYGNGLFVAVGNSGDYVITSPDGINWTARSAAGNNDDWRAVTYGNGLFVAVGDTFGSKDPVMTSPDGINWTARSAAGDNDTWAAVTYGNGLFVAFGLGTDRVMTSPDGITWTVGSVSGNNDTWRSVGYGDNTFVAAGSGTDRVATASWGEQTLTFSGNATVNDFAISASTTVSAPSTLTVTGDFTNNGTFDANDGTIAFNGDNQSASGNLTGSSSLSIVITGDTAFWTARTAAEQNAWNSITYGEGLFVAVSSDGTNRVMTSPDGITWTARTAAEANAWQGVAYGNGTFVAVACGISSTSCNITTSGNRVMTSPDGITWTAQSALGNEEPWVGITYGNGLFVAVANNTGAPWDQIMTSPDGATWTSRLDSGGTGFNSVVYADGLFVAVGSDGIILSGVHDSVATSSDGITWSVFDPLNDTDTWTSVTYGNGLFVAVAEDSTDRVMTSADGSTWTVRTAAEANAWQEVSFATSTFIAVSSDGTHRVMTSPDGITWTTQAAAEANAWQGVTYASSTFVAVGSSGTNRVMTRPLSTTGLESELEFLDNASTTDLTIGLDSIFRAPSALTIEGSYTNNGTFDDNNGTVYVTGENLTFSGNMTGSSAFHDVIASSSIFTTQWTAQSAAATNAWTDVVYADGQFVAVACGINATSCNSTAGGSRVMTSPDGITWTGQTAATANQWQDITYGEGLFVAVGQNGSTADTIMTSPDGVTWTSRSNTETNNLVAVAYGGGRFVAKTSSSNSTIYSDDGITWTVGGFNSLQADSITYGNGTFVGVDMTASNRVITSSDGINWTGQTAAEQNAWIDVTYGDGLFVAVACGYNATSCNTTAGGSRVMTSPDGITWTGREAASAARWQTVAYGDGVFVAADTTSGVVMTSPDGITWTLGEASEANAWNGMAHGTSTFVAVSTGGTNRVMTSPGGVYAESTFTFSDDASTNDLTIAGLTNLIAPALLTISGDYTNNGIFTAGSGTTTFDGSSAQSLEGSMVGTSTFNNLAFDGNGTKTLSDNASTTNLTIESGATVVAPNTFTLTGNFVNDGTYTGGSNLIYIDASAPTDFIGTTTLIVSGSGDTELGNVNVDAPPTNIGEGVLWTARSDTGNSVGWYSVTYNNNLFVAVGICEIGSDCVMTSPDGINWTARSGAGEDDTWTSVTYGEGLFVAVGNSTGNGDSVITSPDGITWTVRTAAGDDDWWLSVTYGNGTFVATGLNGAVMTSPDGITWTAQSAAGGDDHWLSVVYGDSQFVAVGSGNDCVITSPDGITWTARSAAGDNDSWASVTYGNGLFVAVGNSGDRVMTSPDGITWTVRSAAGDNDNWYSVTYGNGLFVAGGNLGDRVMTSPDGITWTVRSAAGDNDAWYGSTYNGTIFVVVGGGDRVMTSEAGTSTAQVVFTGDVETQDLTITTDSLAEVQADVAIAGDYTNLGTVTWESGTTTFNGTTLQTATGTMTGTSQFNNVAITNTSATTSFETAVTASSTLQVVGGAIVEFPAGATSTFTSIDLTGAGSDFITLRSTQDGTQWGFDVENQISVEYVDVKDSNACSGNPNIIAANTIDSGNNDCWDITAPVGGTASISSAANQVFSVGQATTSISAITITDDVIASTITAANDIRITIDTTKTDMLWDTTDTTAVFSGTASGKVSNPVSYENGGATLVIPVSSDFTESDTLTVSELSFVEFGTLNAATSTLGISIAGAPQPGGETWTARTAAGDNDNWKAITYGGGLFVAVSDSGDRVMTSPDGITWTARSAVNNDDLWAGVTYGNGLFVAVGGLGDRVMTSPDGITWTARSAAGNDDSWNSITYGNSLFVAVSHFGDRVMTSPDGTTWTARSAAGNNDSWRGVTYGNGLFVAVSDFGDTVMTSTDGTTWTARSAAGDNDAWNEVTYGNGLFVAVGYTNDRVMTSPDGITWTARSAAGNDDSWFSVAYGDGYFVAVAAGTDRVMTSPDGITWTAKSAAGNNDAWYAITYGNNTFVTVGASGDRVMTAPGGTSGEPVAFDDKTIAISGSLTVANHDAGQATNAFSYQNQTATPLFRFKMTPAQEDATVSTLVFTLSGIRRIDSSNLSSLALYRDMDSDGVYDASDVAIGGAGALSITGQNGTITFATPFSATTSQNYILVGDVTDVKTNEYMTVSFNVSGAVTGDTTGALIPPQGSVSNIQHIRGGGIGAGATSEIGGNVPEGDGDVGGGEQGGGSGEVGEGDGETIGNEPGFRAPAASDGGFTEWTNGNNALSSDGVYATAASTNLRQSYSVFGFNVPTGNTVQGIEVKLEASGSTGAGTIQVALSWNGDQSVTATKATSVLTTSDAVYTLGGPSDTWGRSWTPSEFGDANFFVRVVGQPEGNTVRVDAIQVRPYHQTGGGGGGGGGEI